MPYQIYFRGARISNAVLDTLLNMGLSEASEVLVSGWSAGALTALLHADHIHERLKVGAPNLNKFRVVPISGFFLSHMSKELGPGVVVDITSKVYNEELTEMVTLANSTGALDADCVNSVNSAGECMLAPKALEYVQAPTFILNSGIDEWQVYFLALGAKALPRFDDSKFRVLDEKPGFAKSGASFDETMEAWQECFMSEGFQGCSDKQIWKLIRFHEDFESELQTKVSSVGNGVFVHSCPLHTEALDEPWNTIRVGKISEQEAVLNWWLSPSEDPTSAHTHLDCHLNPSGPKHTCNPSCPKWFASLG